MHSISPAPVPRLQRLAAAALRSQAKGFSQVLSFQSPAHKPAIMESPAPTVESASSVSGRAR